jgi:uncharacterized membrane-anchored protein YitT (DUF2179 family)
MAKGTARSKNRIESELLNALLIVLGIFSAAMGLKGFLLSSGFIDGGVTGVSMLLAQTTGLPLAVGLPLVNIPFIVLAYRSLGRRFAIKSALAILGLALVLGFVPFPDVTPDLVLTALFGGLLIGAGIGLAIRGGAVLDGTEVAALLISKKSHLLKVGDVILIFNVLIFLAAIAVLGVEPALYSILTYMGAAKTLDFVVHGIEEFTAITIVSQEGPSIRKAITGSLGRGVTVLRGYGGIRGEEMEVLYCVVTRLEIGKVKEIVSAVDERAFLTIHSLAAVVGGTVKIKGRH